MGDLTTSVDMAARLMKRFNDVKGDCFDIMNNKRPTYECSGLIIRGIFMGGGIREYPWSKTDNNRKSNAFSYTFLRKDVLFSTFPFGLDNGFIIYPHLKTPHGKFVYPVYCAFPVDAWSDFRK